VKILIISPYYPPYASVAVVRMASLSRFLIDKGCEVTVLRNNFDDLDQNLKTTSIPKGVKIKSVNIKKRSRYITGFIEGFKSYRKNIRELFCKNKYDVVIISAGPFFTLPLCKIIKKEYGVKCIIDFRDLWIAEEIYKGINIKTLISKILFYPIERSAIKYADAVVLVTKGWRNIMMKFYPKYRDKMELIYNGYDDELLNDINIIQDDIQQLLGVFGKMSYYSKEYAKILFSAVKKLKNKYKDLKIVQVGLYENETDAIIEEINFDPKDFNCTGFCDYVEGIQKMSTVSICILIDVRKSGLGTKIYDYIYLNKPIIYIGKKGTDLASFVESFEYGFICETEEEIIQTIDFILSNKIKFLSNKNIKGKYVRSVQNTKYYNLIKKLTDNIIFYGD